MSRGVNKAIIVGNLGNDPEVRRTQSGSAVATISVATSESWTDKGSGQKQTKTEWHKIVFFNRLAEVVEQYLTKGSQVYVEGKLETKKWTDKDGVDRYTTQIIARDMQMLGGRGDNGAPQSQAATRSAQGAPPDSGAPDINFDDDIPFARLPYLSY